MDAIDRKILVELDADPRIPITQLAKKVRVSQQVADYRINRLLENKIITKFGTIINLKALGQEHYRVFFSFNAKKEYISEKIFSYLREQKGVYWAARIGGKYDLLIVLFVYDFAAFDAFIDAFNKEFPGLLRDYKSVYAVEHEFHRHKYLGNIQRNIRYGYNDMVQEVDELDMLILSDIKNDCRMPALEISKGKRISYKTVINRIRSLEKRKIILGYRIFMKSEEKKPFVILFSFKNYSRQAEKGLLDYVRTQEAVTQTVRLFGEWNIFIHVRIESNEKIQELLIDLRDKFDIIDNYEIIPIFEDIAIDLMPTSFVEATHLNKPSSSSLKREETNGT